MSISAVPNRARTTGTKRPVRWSPAFVLIFALCSTRCWSAQPPRAAVEAYKRAVTAVGQREPLACPAGNESASAIIIRRLPVEDSANHAVRPEGALIHHWWAAMFLKHVRAEDVLAVLQDYNHHADIYAPEVRSSNLVDKRGEHYHVLHETLSRSLVTVGLKIDSVIDWSRDKQDGFSSHSTTTHVTEFEQAGTPRARERTPDQAKGWMWAEDSWWHVSTKADGACVTYETIALTRDIPWGWGWLLRGMVERFPAKTLTDMLNRTRSAVLSRKGINLTVGLSAAVAFPDNAQTKHAESKNSQP